jgi:hypothetical protein
MREQRSGPSRPQLSEQTITPGGQFGGMKADDAKRLRELERENVMLKRSVANKELEIVTLDEIAWGTSKPGSSSSPVAHLQAVLGVLGILAKRILSGIAVRSEANTLSGLCRRTPVLQIYCRLDLLPFRSIAVSADGAVEARALPRCFTFNTVAMLETVIAGGRPAARRAQFEVGDSRPRHETGHRIRLYSPPRLPPACSFH